MDERDVEHGHNVGKFSAAHGSDTRSRVALAKSTHVLMASITKEMFHVRVSIIANFITLWP